MPVQRCWRQTNINTTMQWCPVIDGDTTREISQHIVTCAVKDETWRWPVGVCCRPITMRYPGHQMIDSSTSSDSMYRVRRWAKTAIVFYYIFSLLGAKQSSCDILCHQKTTFTGVKLWGPGIIDKELLLRVVTSNLKLAKVLNPYK